MTFRRVHLLILLCWLPASSASSQVYGAANHTVTVQVLPVTDIRVNGGGVNMTMSEANVSAGEDMMAISDETTQIRWATNSSNQKITAGTNLGAPIFTLKLVAVSPTSGTAAPELTLSTTARDLLLGIGRSSGTATMRYTGIALASQGTGTDNHIITITVQAQ